MFKQRPEKREREPWRYLGEETSRQRKQQVQRP